MFEYIMKKLNKPFSLSTTLIIIYLALLSLCIALYALIQIYTDDKGTATNLMIWSATLFPSIALIYTFNTWRSQKSTEVIANHSKQIIYKLYEVNNYNIKVYSTLSDPDNFNKKYNKENVQVDFLNLHKSIKELEKDLHFLNICLKKMEHINDDKYDTHAKELMAFYIEYVINYNNFYEKLELKSTDEENDIQLANGYTHEVLTTYTDIKNLISNIKFELIDYAIYIDNFKK